MILATPSHVGDPIRNPVGDGGGPLDQLQEVFFLSRTLSTDFCHEGVAPSGQGTRPILLSVEWNSGQYFLESSRGNVHIKSFACSRTGQDSVCWVAGFWTRRQATEQG